MFQYQRPLLARSVIAELIMFIFNNHGLSSEIAKKVMQIFLFLYNNQYSIELYLAKYQWYYYYALLFYL